MAADSNLVLQASVAKAATFNSTGVDLKTGTPSRGLVARVLYSAAANASGSNTCIFSIEESSDNVTFYANKSKAAEVVTLSTTAQAGEIFLPFTTKLRYVRLVLTMAGAGGSPTITYQGDVVQAEP